ERDRGSTYLGCRGQSRPRPSSSCHQQGEYASFWGARDSRAVFPATDASDMGTNDHGLDVAHVTVDPAIPQVTEAQRIPPLSPEIGAAPTRGCRHRLLVNGSPRHGR